MPSSAHRQTLLLWVALALYAVLLHAYQGAYAGGADSSGYLNHAELLRSGQIRTPTRALPELPAKALSAYAYIPLGFTPADPGDPSQMVPTYPIGLPLLIAATGTLLGSAAAPGVTLLLHALAGVVLTYAGARQHGIGRSWAALAAAVLATSPLYLFVSVQLLSDMPALVWTTAAALLAWQSRERRGLALITGLAVGMAVLIRPTNLLVLAPVAIAFGRDGRRWLALGIGGLPCAVLMLAHNHAAYGHMLHSGYGPIWQEFDLRFVPAALAHYGRWLPVVLTPLVVAMVAIPAWARGQRRRAAFLGAWAGAFAAFYALYPFTHEAWWYLRFLLPAAPALLLMMGLAGEAIAQRGSWRPARRRLVAAAGAALLLAWQAGWSYRLHALAPGRNEAVYAEASAWARAHVPPRAIVYAVQASGALYRYTDFVCIHWRLLEASDFAALEQAAALHDRPIYALIFPYEEEDFARRLLPQGWKKIAAVRHISVWQRDAAGVASAPATGGLTTSSAASASHSSR